MLWSCEFDEAGTCTFTLRLPRQTFFFEERNVPEKEITSYWVLVSKMCYPQLFGVAFNNKFIVDIIVFSWFKQCN